ncbi:MAG: hypothetical protein AUG49_00840 [Catenulispora sp. 13_1_20CM_3_70_7]|nr:MAG: hypothetical protein AUG49_00840 [Catenulispora sp. 13_1_20CM_3_70_7]
MPRWVAAVSLAASVVCLVVCTLIGSARADAAPAGSAAQFVIGTVRELPQPTPVPPPSPVPGISGPLIGGGSMAPPPPNVGSFGSEHSDPSWWDIPGQIEKAIDTWLGDLVKSALEPVLHLVATSVLSSPDLSGGRIASLWTSVAILANTLYVLFVLAAGILVMAHGTLQTRHTIKEIAPRLVIGIIASNASLWLICQSVSLGNALVAALMSGEISAEGVGSRLTSLIVYEVFLPGGIGALLLVIIGGVIAAMGIALIVTGLVRATVLMVLTAGAPLAFACHALPHTEGLAKLWWRAILGCVATQVAQALVLVVCMQVFFDPKADNILGLPTGGGLTDLLICLVLFFVLIKIPVWTSRVVMHRSAFGQTRITSLARSYLQYQAFGAITSRFGLDRRPPRPGRGGGPPAPSPPAPPSGPGPAPCSGPGHGKFGPLPTLPGEPKATSPPPAGSPRAPAVADSPALEPSQRTRPSSPRGSPAQSAQRPIPASPPQGRPLPKTARLPSGPAASAPQTAKASTSPPAREQPLSGRKPQLRPLREG